MYCIALLVAGYFTYSKVVDRIFGSNPQRATVAIAAPDGVDSIPLPTWKVFFIQLLDIAGIGPIFGPILGALYGPYALLWIVAGTIFAGGVHDYFSGMLSVRHGGGSLPEVIGEFMGRPTRALMRLFSVLLLLLVAVVIAFILQSNIGFGLAPTLSNIAGVVGAALALGTLVILHATHRLTPFAGDAEGHVVRRVE